MGFNGSDIMTLRNLSSNKLQVLPPRRSNFLPENRALDFLISLVKWAHDSLDIVLVDFIKEVLDSLFCLRTGWIGCN